MLSREADPLTEHLIRSTDVALVETPPTDQNGGDPRPRASLDPSAAPRRNGGTRVRAGNAMRGTRSALLDGAARAAGRDGTRITMGAVAASAGVAKATLYNHFRTREAVLAALVVREIEALADEVSDLALEDAVARVAGALSTHPVLRRLAAQEPGMLVALARVDPRRPGWACAQSAVESALGRAGRSGSGTVLRWLSSFLLTPAAPVTVRREARALLDGLPGSTTRSSDDGRPAAGQCTPDVRSADEDQPTSVAGALAGAWP